MTNRDFDQSDNGGNPIMIEDLNLDKEIILSCLECDKEKAVTRCVYETIEPLNEAVRVESLCMECGQGTKGSETFHLDRDGNEISYGIEEVNDRPDNATELVSNE